MSLDSLHAATFAEITRRPFLQRVLDTVELTGNQWLICIGAGLLVVVVSEAWKFVLRRHESSEAAAAA